MTRRDPGPPDEGSAVVEFVFLAVLMLVPIVYLVVALGRIQAGALAAEQGAREAGRAFVTAPDDASGARRARAAATIAYADQGFGPPGAGQLAIACGSSPCLAADARVTVRSQLTIVLPWIPRFLDRVVPLEVTVSAMHISTVDAFGAS